MRDSNLSSLSFFNKYNIKFQKISHLTEFMSLLLYVSFMILLIWFGEGYFSNEGLQNYYYIFLASIAVITMFVSPEKGLYILIVVMLFSPEFKIGQVGRRKIIVRYDDLMIILGMLSWLLVRILKKNVKLFVTSPLDKPILFFVFICALSTTRGVLIRQVENPLAGFLYIMKLSEYFLIYYVVLNTVTTKDMFRKYLIVFILTLLFVSLAGVQQIHAGAYRVSTPFEDIPEPNTLGGYLVFMIGFVLSLAILGVNLFTRWFLWILLPFVTYVFLYTLSRGSYLAFFPVLITTILLVPKKKKFLAIVIFVGCILSIRFLPNEITQRIENTFNGPISYRIPTITGDEKEVTLDKSSSARIEKYKMVINYWAEYPIFGLGITGAGFIDSTVFRTIGELGLMGIFAIIWLFTSILSETINSYKYSRNRLNKGLCIGYLSGFVGLMIHATTANTFFLIRIMGPFWFLTALVILVPQLYFNEIAYKIKRNELE